MNINTEEVMAEAITRMDDAYANLRKLVADESVLNSSCTEMQAWRAGLNDAISAVFETRNAFNEIKRRRMASATKPPVT